MGDKPFPNGLSSWNRPGFGAGPQWGPEYQGFAGRMKIWANYAKKPFVWPFLLAAGTALAAGYSIQAGLTDEQKAKSVFSNRRAIMERKRIEHLRKAGGYAGLEHH